MAVLLPIWVAGGFFLAQIVAGVVLDGLKALGVSFSGLNSSMFQTIVSAVVYLFTLAIVIGLPWLIRKSRTTKAEIGFTQHMAWLDIALALGGFFIYLALSSILTNLATHLPFYNADQAQDTGFVHLSQGYEYLLAFLTLVVIAPVCEEILFRGYLLGKLRKYVPVWVAILVTSALFGAIHLQLNVGVDVFALSIILCLLRVGTGRLWPSIVLHMIKNGLAFYFLFINPIL